MNRAVEQWLAARISVPGTLAGGVRSPDGQFLTRSVDESHPPGTIEAVLRQFDEIRAVFFQAGVLPRWSTWSYGQGQIRFVPRLDGWLFALAVRPETDAVQSLDSLTREFLALQPLGE